MAERVEAMVTEALVAIITLIVVALNRTMRASIRPDTMRIRDPKHQEPTIQLKEVVAPLIRRKAEEEPPIRRKAVAPLPIQPKGAAVNHSETILLLTTTTIIAAVTCYTSHQL